MAYRNKTYVAFDADNDMHYYRLMQAWKQNDRTEFDFYNAHELNNLRPTSSEETIKHKLRERLLNSKVLVVLIGNHTKDLYKFVRWEIEQGLKLGLPIIGVNLNGKRALDRDLCPPVMRDTLAVHVAYGPKIMQYALENWPSFHDSCVQNGTTGAHFYKDATYESLSV